VTVPLSVLFAGPVSGDEGRAFLRGLLGSAPYPIPPIVLDTPGAPEGAIVWALGEAEALRSADRLAFARSAYRSTASREWLAVQADEIFGLVVRDADFATTTVTLANSSGALYGPFAEGQLRFVNTSTKKVFVNTAEVTIPIGPSSVVVGVRALEAGSASNAGVSAIDKFETPLEDVSVANPQPALGQDAEDAASINRRIDARIGAFGVAGAGFSTGGTESAFASIALSGADGGGGVLRPDGSRVTVTRTKTERDDAAGTVTLFLADDDGPLEPSDLALVADEVQAYAEWIGSEVIVSNASAVTISISGTLTIAATTADDAAILARIDDELVAASRAAPIGGTVIPPATSGVVTLDEVREAILCAGRGGVVSFQAKRLTLTAPIADVSLAAGAVPILARVTLTIARVS